MAKEEPKAASRWTSEEDAILAEHYATRGFLWCAGQMPWRTVSAVRSRAVLLHVAPTRSEGQKLSFQRRMEAAGTSEGKSSPWTPPAPRYASVWDMAQGVSV